MTLNLHQRAVWDAAAKLTQAGFIADITPIARGWSRNTRRTGGYTSGGFIIDESQVSQRELMTMYETWIGRQIQEVTYGVTSWEGYIARLTLTLDGVTYETSLEPDLWHNSVDVYYSNAAVVDTEQGTLSATGSTFTDTGQDFSAWATTSGDAAYRLQAVNSDGKTGWGYIGAASPITQANIYQDVGRTTPGWNDEDLNGDTITSYQVIQVSLEGSRTNVGWSENATSQNEFGKMQYIISLAGAKAAAATALRDRHLAQHAWPRSRMVNVAASPETHLEVVCGGFWNTLFWRYRINSVTDAASTLVTAIVNDSEFVKPGYIDNNTLEITADAYPMPQRLGDLLLKIAQQGDADGNAWNVGVYNEKKLDYGQRDTDVRYRWHRGALRDSNGIAVVPELLRPGFLMRGEGALMYTPPPGSTADAESASVSYIEEVDWSADDRILTLTLVDQEGSLATLRKRINEGTI